MVNLPAIVTRDVEPVPEKVPEELSLPQFYLLEQARLDGCISMIDDQLKEIIGYFTSVADAHKGRIQREHARLVFIHGKEFKQAVASDLKAQGGKKKSIDYLAGKAGYRAGRAKIEIEDETRAIHDAELNHPHVLKTSLLKSELMKLYNTPGPDGKPSKTLLCGTTFVAGENTFFPSVDTTGLPEPDKHPTLEA